MTTWSHSRLQTYESCPRKFKYRYIDEIEPATDSIYAFMGKRVHEALENLYKSVQFGNILPLDKLLERYAISWETEKKKPLSSIPAEMTEDDFRRLGERCINNYYHRYHPFNQDTTLGIEERISVDLQDASGVIKITGIIDRISRGQDGTVRIHDYKTGKIESQGDLDEDRQLALYQIGLRQRWPDMQRFELVWHYVKFGEELKSRRSPEQLESLKVDISTLVRQIESDKIYEPRKSGLCNFCEYQPICPLWKPLHDLKSMPVEERVATVELVDRYGELKDAKKIIEAEIEDLERQLVDQLLDEPKQALFGTRWRIIVTRTDGIHIPPKGKPARQQLEEILKTAGIWESVTALDTTAFKKLVAAKKLDADILVTVEPLLDREISHRFSLGKQRADESNEDDGSVEA